MGGARGEELVWAIAGAGTRRWRLLAHRPEGEVMGVAARDVRRRLRLRLQGDGEDRERARELLAEIDALGRDGLAVAGYVGHEVGMALEGLDLPPPAEPVDRAGRALAMPDAELVVFEPSALVTRPGEGARRHRRPEATPQGPAEGALPEDLLRRRGRWLEATREALERIGRGAMYQVNLSVSFCVEAPAPGGTEGLLRAALGVQAVPYAMVLRTPAGVLVSGSMERALGVEAGEVRSRPIKGTRARGEGARGDRHARLLLLGDAKERAENTMIVDMVRNDLSRFCLPGTVRVPELLAAVPYETLWHLESEVAGRLALPCPPSRSLAATLPPASVTGCPKVAALRFIAAAEGRRRGSYCGVLGIALPGGDADWSVGIRQVVLGGGRARLSVGSGIVADSVPEREWAETCLKAASGLRFVAAMAAAGGGGGGA